MEKIRKQKDRKKRGGAEMDEKLTIRKPKRKNGTWLKEKKIKKKKTYYEPDKTK